MDQPTSAPSAAAAAVTLPVRPEVTHPTARRTGRRSFRAARVDRYRLANGLRVLVWEDGRAPVFSYQTWFGVGSRHDQVGRTGIAHLFEHMMFKATRHMGDGALDVLLETRGAETNAATWLDWTHYREKLPAIGDNLELVVRLEADRMEHLVLDEHQLETERDVVLNERLLRVDDDPMGQMTEALYELAFSTHPYRQPTIGWADDIRAITLEDCRAFYERYYAPDNATIVVVGAVEAARVLALVERYYGHMPAQPRPAPEPVVEPSQTEPRGRELALEVAAERGLYAWHAPAGGTPEHAALEILGEILTGGESSRLYRRLVAERELASRVSGWTPELREPGLFEAMIQLQPGRRLVDAEAELEAVLEDVRTHPVGERELRKARNGLEASFLRQMADTGHRARGLGEAETTFDSFERYFDSLEALQRVGAEDVLAVARQVFRTSNRTRIHAVPKG